VLTINIPRFIKVGLSVLAFYASSVAADLVVVFDNGLPNTTNGYSIRLTAETRDDFLIAEGATITHVTFYYQNYDGITGWNQDITYNIWDAQVGGNLLASGAGVNVTPVDSGLPWCCGGGNAWKVDFDLQAGFEAAPGTRYWLGLTGASGSNNSWWVTADYNNGLANASGVGPYDGDFAFSLSSGSLAPPSAPYQPVPVNNLMALALLMLLLVSTGFIAVRRQR